jgi:hypothetical protein
MMRKHVPVSLPCMYDHEFKINSRITSITPQNPPVVWTPHDALSRSLAGAAFVSMGKAQQRQGRSGQVCVMETHRLIGWLTYLWCTEGERLLAFHLHQTGELFAQELAVVPSNQDTSEPIENYRCNDSDAGITAVPSTLTALQGDESVAHRITLLDPPKQAKMKSMRNKTCHTVMVMVRLTA